VLAPEAALVPLAPPAAHESLPSLPPPAPTLAPLAAAATGPAARTLRAAGHRLRRLIDPEFDRQYERILERLGPNDFDPFGFNVGYARYVLHAAAWMYRRYFRCRVEGLERIPPGRALLVANHSGQLPIDGMMIATALLLDHEPPRLVRSMIEKWAATLPAVSTFFARCGQVVGLPENCRLLLEREELILVFPEGAKGISKTIDRAYQLEEFGSGFVRLALENRSPIVPVAVVGAEEQYPAVANLTALAELIGAPALPVSPLFLLGPVGLLPLPTRYHIAFGEPIWLEGDVDEEDERVTEHVRRVRSAVQDLLRRTLERREGVFR
jgi:1-acyl-sn-glycerol-3-phosphate acyltransferase